MKVGKRNTICRGQACTHSSEGGRAIKAIFQGKSLSFQEFGLLERQLWIKYFLGVKRKTEK